MKTYALRLRTLCLSTLIILATLALSSCRVQAVTASANSSDSIRQSAVQMRVDSIYVHDSIYIRERGDTVFVDRWHVRWKDRAITKADTVYVDRQQSEVKISPPQRYIPKFYKWCTGILCSLLAAGILWLIGQLILRHR